MRLAILTLALFRSLFFFAQDIPYDQTDSLSVGEHTIKDCFGENYKSIFVDSNEVVYSYFGLLGNEFEIDTIIKFDITWEIESLLFDYYSNYLVPPIHEGNDDGFIISFVVNPKGEFVKISILENVTHICQDDESWAIEIIPDYRLPNETNQTTEYIVKIVDHCMCACLVEQDGGLLLKD